MFLEACSLAVFIGVKAFVFSLVQIVLHLLPEAISSYQTLYTISSDF